MSTRRAEVRLYIASDEDRMVVATRRPRVIGPRRESTAAGVALIVTWPDREGMPPGGRPRPSMVSPHPPGAGLALRVILAALGLTALATLVTVNSSSVGPIIGPAGLGATAVAGVLAWRQQQLIARRWPGSHRVLHNPADRQALLIAHRAACRIAAAWPAVREMVGVPDAQPAVAQALWELTTVLAVREALRATWQDLARTLEQLAEPSRLREEVSERTDEAARRYHEIDRQAGWLSGQLLALSAQCTEFVRQQEAVDQARRTVRGADELLGALPGPADGIGQSWTEAGELQERTGAVLRAYQELSRHLGVDGVL